MLETGIAVALVLCSVGGFAEENVKNETAAGSYVVKGEYVEPPHYAYTPSFYGGFNYDLYGFGRPREHLINTHVCSIDASYAVYSHPEKKRLHPFIMDCAHSYIGDNTSTDHGKSQVSCDRCCKQAARLENMKESEILGMMLVTDGRAKCACCAPYRPYMDLLGMAVRHPTYQPSYQTYQSYQPPVQPDYGQPVYPTK